VIGIVEDVSFLGKELFLANRVEHDHLI